MRICFITDGGLQMGMGHVQQSTTIAKELRGSADICFLTKSDETVMTMIRESGFDVACVKSDSEILRRLAAMEPDLVIVDKIDFDEALARDIKRKLKARLIIFTNLTDANRYADVAVTADIGSEFKNITYSDPDTGTLYFYGPRYWVLRGEFHEYKKKGKAPARETERVLLVLGGSDPSNLTSAVLEELLGLGRMLRIEVILGAHFGHDDCLNLVLQRKPQTKASVAVYRNIKNVAELMYEADLVIASPGLSVFEALCVGTPVIVMPQDALQRDTYKGFMRMLERGDVRQLGGMIERADFTFPSESHIARMEIGEGAQELLEVILASARR